MDKIEVMSNEICEINNIIALAKADSEIEQVLLTELIHEFGDKIGDTKFNLVNEKQLEDIITIVEENLEYNDRCRNDNCEVYAIVEDRQRVKQVIRETLENSYWKAEELMLNQAEEKRHKI